MVAYREIAKNRAASKVQPVKMSIRLPSQTWKVCAIHTVDRTRFLSQTWKVCATHAADRTGGDRPAHAKSCLDSF